jgi:hypothetical protein
MSRRDFYPLGWHVIVRRWPERDGSRWSVDLWSDSLYPNRWTLDVCAGTRMVTVLRALR